MSEISPTASQQLAAAAIAFHRARRKFSEHVSESTYKNPERIQVSNKTENSTRLRALSGFRCGRNCEPVESAFHQEKTGRDAVRDFVKIVSNRKYPDAPVDAPSAGANETEEFKDAQDRLDVSSEIGSPRPTFKKNCSCYNRMSILHQKPGDGDSINQLRKTESPEMDDRGNDDESLDFPRKLYEWERRSREESLMKMQRLYQRRNRIKQKPKCQSLQCHSHYCQMHHYPKCISKPMNSILMPNRLSFPPKWQCPKFLYHWKCDVEREAKDYCRKKLHSGSNSTQCSGMCSRTEDSETDDEESLNNVPQIKHRDSVDILVEKLKSKSIQDEQSDEVGEFCSGISETVSCSGIQDLVSNETTEEAKSCEDSVDSETCCTRKNSSTKELRFNKLADRLKHKSRRSRLTKLAVHYQDESPTAI
ncbi:uncharacterized protein LOC107043759 [Diachasma alloeum]|uniref:uncharacterized protein LOC107043759 n=1 Tax=Diachasma alloeum TaxID=454923 RepID=UPI00073830BE|nr:uncharacterized protein LOC107043759 [Diachasma alloeum]